MTVSDLERRPPQRADLAGHPGCDSGPEIEALVREMIGRVADKWTMLILEELSEHRVLRFTRLGQLVGGISQKMLTKTLRQLESDGLVERTVFPVVPPHVEYRLTHLGDSLSEAFCGVWEWAEKYHREVARARHAFQPTNASPTRTTRPGE
ncbi:winged helix-turn-helix transcriptional regulator [Deinococcus sp.]|uniref:winged helix-turn-helix transcriptional regulator n=1 Tax=Deinococcus sp. TaxID=47478 RepID=UPI003C79A961